MNKEIDKNGSYFYNKNNMTNTALIAFKSLLKEPVLGSWDDICEVFDTIKGKGL